MVGLFQEIEELLKGIEYKIISHVRCEGNKLVDYLDNWGSKETKGKVDNRWTPQLAMTRWENLRQIIEQDINATITTKISCITRLGWQGMNTQKQGRNGRTASTPL